MPFVHFIFSLACIQLYEFADFRWHNRLLLISGDDEVVSRVIDYYLDHSSELLDRELLLFKIGIDRWECVNCTKPISIRTEEQAQNQILVIRLIGKDGSTKLTSNTLVNPQKLFALIDSMPMRQAEMHRRKQYSNE